MQRAGTDDATLRYTRSSIVAAGPTRTHPNWTSNVPMCRYPLIRRSPIASTMRLALFAAGIVAAISTAALARAPDVRRPFDATQSTTPAGFDERDLAIVESLKTSPASRWAGSYYQGDGLGENIRLRLAPEAGVTATWNGCLGLYGINHGSLVERDDGVILMSYVASNEPTTAGGFPEALIPVRWGERQYLIPPDRMPEFVSAINHGFEPKQGRYGLFLLRDGDENKPVAGLPLLPPGTQAQVRRKPVRARIATVELRERTVQGQWCASTYTVGLVTSDEPVPPLFAGEELRSTRGYEVAKVIAQQGRSAQAEIRIVEVCDKERAPVEGRRFTTGAYRKK